MERRGLCIEDHDDAELALRSIGYFALSGYWYPMRRADPQEIGRKIDQFIDGASFNHALRLYEFDFKLRSITSDALQRVERALKVEVALVLGPLDAFAHMNGIFMRDANLVPKGSRSISNHQNWIDQFQKKYRNHRDVQLQEFVDKYSEPLPIWVAIDVMDFGSITSLLGMLKAEYSNSIAKRFELVSGSDAASFLKAMNHLRNTCAHHGRLWNRVHTIHPRMPVGDASNFFYQFSGRSQTVWERTYASLLTLSYLHSQLDTSSKWSFNLSTHLKTFEPGFGITFESLGVTANWSEHPTWN